MDVAGNRVERNNVYLDDDQVVICGSDIEAIQVAELLGSGYSVVDYNLGFADDVFATDEEAEEYLGILESLLDAQTQEERDDILRICAHGSYPDLPQFVIAAIKRVGEKNAPALISTIRKRMPDLFDDLYDYLMIA